MQEINGSVKRKTIISIYYTDSQCKPVILNNGTAEHISKKQFCFYGLKSEIDNKVNNLISDSPDITISHAIVHGSVFFFSDTK